MSRIVVIRHAPTPWNRARRLQGRSDTALDAEGQAIACTWRTDPSWRDYRLISSPLMRARQTAALLFPGQKIFVDDALIEMSFGLWEGKSLAALRAIPGGDARLRETMGLDFQAPGGESPRAVQARLRPFLAKLAHEDAPAVLVTHKAVLRALYALATGWTMTAPPPQRLRDGCAQIFDLDISGRPRVVILNRPLVSGADGMA